MKRKQGKARGIPLDEVILEAFKDPRTAKSAMMLALEEFEKDNDLEILLDTLRLVAQAQGGIAQLARKADVSRKALHEALSADGNPRLRTFQSMLNGLGLRMSLKAASAEIRAR